MNVKLTEAEKQIIIQCIQQLNFSGKHVREVGILVDKLIKSLEQNKKNATME